MQTKNIHLLIPENCLGGNFFNTIYKQDIIYFPKVRKVVFSACHRDRNRNPSLIYSLQIYDFHSNSLEKIELEDLIDESCAFKIKKISKISETKFLLFSGCKINTVNFHIFTLPALSSELLLMEKSVGIISDFSSIVNVRKGTFVCGMRDKRVLKISLIERKMVFLKAIHMNKEAKFKEGESRIVPSKKYENSFFLNSFMSLGMLSRINDEFLYDTFILMIDFEKDEAEKEFEVEVHDKGNNNSMEDMTTFLNKKGDEILISIMFSSYLHFFDVESTTCIKKIIVDPSIEYYSRCLHCSDKNGYLFIGTRSLRCCVIVMDLFEEYNCVKYHLKMDWKDDSLTKLIPIISETSSSAFQFIFLSSEERGKLRTFQIEGLRMNGMDRMEVFDMKERISFVLNESVILRLKIHLENLSLNDIPRFIFLL